VTVQGADQGDTTTIADTVTAAAEELEAGAATTDGATAVIEEAVADKGYHSNQTLVDFAQLEVRTYIAEPHRGRRNWKKKPAAKAAVYANRRRIHGARGLALLRRRSERLERPNAHLYETGGMRRTHLRGHTNILKRLFVHVGGFNLELFMRTRFGIGTPRSLQGRAVLVTLAVALWMHIVDLWYDRRTSSNDHVSTFMPRHRFELLPVSPSAGVL
jgi:transposase